MMDADALKANKIGEHANIAICDTEIFALASLVGLKDTRLEAETRGVRVCPLVVLWSLSEMEFVFTRLTERELAIVAVNRGQSIALLVLDVELIVAKAFGSIGRHAVSVHRVVHHQSVARSAVSLMNHEF